MPVPAPAALRASTGPEAGMARRVLLVTAHSRDVVREMGYAGPVVEKPFKASDLSACLAELVSRKPEQA